LYGEIKDGFAASFSATKAEMGNLITSTEGTQWTAVIRQDLTLQGGKVTSVYY